MRKIFWSSSVVSVIILFAGILNAGMNWEPLEGSRLWFEGDSTAHPYSVEATRLDATIQVESGLGPDTSILSQKFHQAMGNLNLKQMEFSIPVSALKSNKKGLDKKMAKALKIKEHPMITFRLNKYTILKEVAQHEYHIQAQGSLSVAGIAREIIIEVKAKPKKEAIVIHGKKELLMTQFGIEPPTAMLGMLKTKDPVIVYFEWTIGTNNKRRVL